MTAPRASRPLAPGSIVELPRPGGLAYVQLTHRHPSYPEVLRLLARGRGDRPADLQGLSAFAPPGPAMLFPLGAALAAGRLAGGEIGTAPVPAPLAPFPTFRMAVRDRAGAVVYWWLWDGDSLRPVAADDPEAAALPLRAVLSLAAFTARL